MTDDTLVTRRPAGTEELEREIEALKNAQNPPAEPVVTDTEQDIESEVTQTKEEATFKKRYGDLRRHSQKVENDLKARIQELEDKLNSGTPTAMPTTPEEVKKWVESYPQVASIIIALADEQATKKTEEVSSRLQQIERDAEALRIEKAKDAVRAKHPDYDSIVVEDDFHDWLEDQPTSVQDAIYDGSVKDVIWGLSQYKRERGIKETESTREAAKAAITRKSNTAEPKTQEKATYSESKVNAMSVAEYEKHAADIRKAQANGTFVYDITGGAR